MKKVWSTLRTCTYCTVVFRGAELDLGRFVNEGKDKELHFYCRDCALLKNIPPMPRKYEWVPDGSGWFALNVGNLLSLTVCEGCTQDGEVYWTMVCPEVRAKFVQLHADTPEGAKSNALIFVKLRLEEMLLHLSKVVEEPVSYGSRNDGST